MIYDPPIPVEAIAKRLGTSEWVVRALVNRLRLVPVYNTHVAPRYVAEDVERIRAALEDGHDLDVWDRCGPGWQRRHHGVEDADA